jgi:hypothetical protein
MEPVHTDVVRGQNNPSSLVGEGGQEEESSVVAPCALAHDDTGSQQLTSDVHNDDAVTNGGPDEVDGEQPSQVESSVITYSLLLYVLLLIYFCTIMHNCIPKHHPILQ